MEILLRILLIAVSAAALFFVLHRIRRQQVQIEDAIYWIILMPVLVLAGIFPRWVILLSAWIGIESPANFVFLCIIFLLLAKVFHLSLQVSKQQYQIRQLAMAVALREWQGAAGKGSETGKGSEENGDKNHGGKP